MELEKPNPTRSWIWWGIWRAKRRVSTGVEKKQKLLSSKSKTRENVGLLLNENTVMTKAMEKAKILCAFVALIFTSKSGLQQPQAPESSEEI